VIRRLVARGRCFVVDAASLNLLPVTATAIASGSYLNAATATQPVAVLDAAAAQRLGIDRVYPDERIWVAKQWFYVAGILNPSVSRAPRRHLRAGRLPRRPALPRLQHRHRGRDKHRAAEHDLRPRPKPAK
jgi:hypothetical protein